jgi:hypothetical protein
VVVALSLLQAYYAKNALQSGKDSLVTAQQKLVAGDISGAQAAFRSAEASFAVASSRSGSPLLRLESWVPLVGRTPRALRDMSSIGARVAAAGESVTQAVSSLPNGMGSLAPSNGSIPLSTIATLEPSLQRASQDLQDAQTQAAALPTSLVPASVRDAATTVQGKLAQAVPMVRSAAAVAGALPAFAGQDGARRYFVAAQNPAELRGTGGFMGEWAILTLDHGKVSLGPFNANPPADPPPSLVTPVTKGQSQLYGARVTSAWRMANMMPDAPTAGADMVAMWNATHPGQKIDGVIWIDPQALSYMLRATGPVRSGALGTTLTSSNVVDLVTNKEYFSFGDQATRKSALGAAAGDVWTRFLATSKPSVAVRSLVTAAANGDIVIFAQDPAVENAFRLAGVTGDWAPSSGDFFGTAVNNFAGNKVDYYMERNMTYDVWLQPNGASTAGASVTLSNTAPAGQPPSYALGPYQAGYLKFLHLTPGENYSLVSSYCAPGCTLQGSQVSSQPAGLEAEQENGLQLFATFVALKPQESQTLSLKLQNNGAWQGNSDAGVYTLWLQAQNTVRPVTGSVTIHAPSGMVFTGPTPPGVSVDGSTATWKGTIGKRVALTLSFAKPFWSQVWGHVTDFFRRPV